MDPNKIGACVMELVLIAFVGTVLLLTAELRDFVRRRGNNALSVEFSSAPYVTSSRYFANESRRAENEDLYDAAA
jgi:hypothetical protein